MKTTSNIAGKTKEIVKKHGKDKSSLIGVLQDIQEAFNYLPKQALKTAASAMNVPFSRVYEAATFYTAFSLKPRGENIVKICVGTAMSAVLPPSRTSLNARWVLNQAKPPKIRSFRWKPSTVLAPAHWDQLCSLIPNTMAK
jgi:hypothetical protein